MKLETDKTRFLKQLQASIHQFANRVASENLPHAYASFEILCAIYSAKGIDKDEIAATYLSDIWRNDAALVPRAILRPIVEGWVTHREGEADLSRAMGLAADSKGKKPAVKAELKRERDVRLSNQVVLELIEAELNNTPISVDAACAAVQEKTHPKVTYRVVERAYRTYGYDTKKAVLKTISDSAKT